MSALGMLGHNGMAAYLGLLEIGRPQPGETVVVSSAAGATGSLVGQIAKIKGCRVIGIARGAKKCRWLMEKAGFDAATGCLVSPCWSAETQGTATLKVSRSSSTTDSNG